MALTLDGLFDEGFQPPRQETRARPPAKPAELRKRGFDEVEGVLSEENARGEARRCLRCDLEFTMPDAE